MIRSFGDKETERVWNGERSRKLPPDIHRRGRDTLLLIDAAEMLEDLRSPTSNRLHGPRDDRLGQHSISKNDQWRICFVWKDGDARDVQIVDYH